MAYAAKPPTSTIPPSVPSSGDTRYELFTTVKAIDTNLQEVDIYQSIGFYSINQLNSQIASYNQQIADCQAKIDAIMAIQ